MRDPNRTVATASSGSMATPIYDATTQFTVAPGESYRQRLRQLYREDFKEFHRQLRAEQKERRAEESNRHSGADLGTPVAEDGCDHIKALYEQIIEEAAKAAGGP